MIPHVKVTVERDEDVPAFLPVQVAHGECTGIGPYRPPVRYQTRWKAAEPTRTERLHDTIRRFKAMAAHCSGLSELKPLRDLIDQLHAEHCA